MIKKKGNITSKKSKILVNFLRTIIRKNTKVCIYALLIMTCVTILDIILPKIIQNIIDNVISKKSIRLLIILAVTYIVISIIISALNILKEVMISRVKKQVAIHYKLKMLKKLSEFSGEYYSNIKTGEIINLIDGDCNIIENFGIEVVFNIVSNIFKAILSLYFLCTMQIDMLLIVIILQVAITWIQLIFTNSITKRTKVIREESGIIFDYIQQYVSNIIQVIICKSKKYFFKEYISKVKEFINKAIVLDIIYASNGEIAGLLSSFITIFIYAYGAYKIMNGKMTIGQLIAFQQYTWLFIGPCVSILRSNTSIQKMRVSLERIDEFLNQTDNIGKKSNRVLMGSQIQKIEFKNVMFSYNNNQKMVLNEVNLNICSGKLYAFVGKTGCGKSTLINLLYRLWDTKEGLILINNINIRKYNLNSLRKNISIVSQNLYILDDTIEKNLTIGDSSISDEQCKLVCRQLGLDDFINSLPDGYQTLVGENGAKLSGGQKQRVVIGRMLLQSKNILIFDEATSALDNITQNLILKNIKEFYKDKIVLIIAHRLSTVKNADIIYALQNGIICESGSHEQLMCNKGYYYKLVREQED